MLGLKTIDERIYLAMLTTPGSGVAELCHELDLPETAVREALDRLADLTLLRPSLAVDGSLRPVAPQVGLEALLARQEDQLAVQRQALAVSKAVVALSLADCRVQPYAPSPTMERLVGADVIHTRIEVLSHDTHSEFLTVMPVAAQPQNCLDARRSTDRSVLERGGRVATLFHDSVHDDPAASDYAAWLTELGGGVRTAAALPPRLLVMDRRVAVVPLDPDDPECGALCTTEPGFVAALVAVFEHAWATAVPPSPRRSQLTPMEREVLRLLGTGLTDEVVGRCLGISLRTVRRHMSTLMQRLDARSRFEAGIKAARNGWL
ncbi:LuxR C-terminal-related transcriptional regulator [Streptomyces sp. NPDC048669]|uniref:helix-turn-helix transcriptional regulator n=1 Tax=Streptomyces sp. NPDC048669 TaxID=3155267 RepID=UPI003423568B